MLGSYFLGSINSFDNFNPTSEAFRLGPDGSLIWRYSLDLSRWVTPVTFMAATPDDRLVLFPSRKMLDARTGQYVGRFPIPPEVIAATTAYFQEPDGRLILAGTFTNYAGILRLGLAAVLPDGTLDPSFDPGLGTTEGFKVELSSKAACAVGTADGGMFVGGGFPRNLPGISGEILKLDAAGRIDPLFRLIPPAGSTECPGAVNQPVSLWLERDGTLLAAGEFARTFGCDSGWSLVRVSPSGQILDRWSIPQEGDLVGLRLRGSGSDFIYLFAGQSVFRVTATGPRRLDGVSLTAGSSPVVLQDGRLAGVGETWGVAIPVRVYQTNGALQGQVVEFEAAGDRWLAAQMHALTERADGAVLVSGLFYSATRPTIPARTMTLAFEPDAVLFGMPVVAVEVNALGLRSLVPHPTGQLAGLPVLPVQGLPSTNPKWWRLDSAGGAISDVAIRNLVADAQGQVHFALSGQAPSGYTLEMSEDLENWTTWFSSTETNWGMAFHTPPLPPEWWGRFFRIR